MRNRVLALAAMLASVACNAILGIDEKVAVDAGATTTMAEPDGGDFAVAIAQPAVRIVAGQDASVDVTLQRSGRFAGAVAALVVGLPAGVTADSLTFSPSQTMGKLVFHSLGSADLGEAQVSVIPAAFSGFRAALPLRLIVQAAPGTLDTTFGVSGRVVSPMSITAAGIGAGGVRIGPDGSVLLCGSAHAPNADSSVLLLRLTADGSLDPNFGNGGILFGNSPGSTADGCNSAVLRPSGGVAIAGFARPSASGPRALMAARFTNAGTGSSGFGMSGWTTTPLDGADSTGYYVLGLDSDRIIVAGKRSSGPVLVQYLRGSGLDTTFGAGIGMVTGGPAGAAARWLAQQSTGHYIAAVDSTPFHVLRIAPDGALENFGNGAAADIDVGGHGFSSAMVALVKPDDGVVAVGMATGDSGTKDIAVEFLNGSGQIDTTVLPNGWALAHFGQADSIVSSAALQADGTIVVAGQSSTDAGQAFTVMRFASNGSIDTTFGPGGRRTFDVNGTAQGIAVDALGRLVVAGTSGNAADSSIVVYRIWP
jgi:uncharacterized delta-60 repeat protein